MYTKVKFRIISMESFLILIYVLIGIFTWVVYIFFITTAQVFLSQLGGLLRPRNIVRLELAAGI